MIFETLYRVDPRGKSFNSGDFASLSETEYYQPTVDWEFQNGKHIYFVREKHGFFDDQQKEAAGIGLTLDPEEGFATEAEAWASYEERLRHRARNGFVHAFSPKTPEREATYRVLDPNAASLLLADHRL